MLIVVVLVVIVGVLLYSRRVQSQLGGRAQAVMYRHFLRSGELPPDADVPRWSAYLESSIRRTRRPVLLLLPLGIVIVLGLVVAVVSSVNGDISLGRALLVQVPAVIVVAAFGALFWWLILRQVPVLEQRLAVLRGV